MSSSNKKYYNEKEVTIRPAGDKDMRIVFDLANDEAVRRNSFTPEKIKLEDHKKWFKNKIKDKNYLILLAEVKGIFAGQVRFEINHQEAIIGVSVCQKFRGYGLGTIIISKGLDYLRSFKTTTEKVLAFIKEDNPASVKLFEKCGFRYERKTLVKSQKAFKYILKLGGIK